MKVDLQGRVALVTGAGQNIGKAIALALAENGAWLAVNDINPSCEETAKEIRRRGGTAKAFLADVSDARAVDALAAGIEQEWGKIDILVNNAAVFVGSMEKRFPIHAFLDEDWERILRVDLNGVFYCSRAVSAEMVKRRRGVIINIASVAGLVPLRLQSAYDVAKAGVVNLTRCQAVEVGQYGVRVNAIAPGSTLTDGTRQMFYNPAAQKFAESLLSHVPLGRPGETSDIAHAAVYLASDEASYVTGHVLVVDGGWTAGFVRDW
jgi:NAD(P)-dependent dehydrogenase (short-subunit alcohol dehydrogenase family)